MSQVKNPSNPELATNVYRPLGARSTEDDCRAMSKRMSEILPDEPAILLVYCLPDTIDPRGPKAAKPN